MIAYIIFFLVGGFFLGIAWMLFFWIASFIIYILSRILAILGINFNISGETNVWILFWLIAGISYYIFDISNFAYALFIFITGCFMLFKNASMWMVNAR